MVVLIHAVRMLMGRAVARAIGLFSLLRESFVESCEIRTRIEAELFRGRYHGSSKNDDDLPIVR